MCSLISIAIPWEGGVQSKETEKLDKYRDPG